MGQVQSCSPALRDALRSGKYAVLLRSGRDGYEVSHHPWDPMDPPEVGPRWSPGLSGHVRSSTRYSEAHYNAPYHSAMSQCIAGTAEQRAKWCTRSPIP